jgi:NitT/TauT family transport system ATP-binding protein
MEDATLRLGRFQNVRKVYARKGKDPLVVIDDISFDLTEGSLVSLLGPSGCGKTTLLKIVAGLDRATSGLVEVRGRAVNGPHEDFAFVFQQPNLMPWRDVLANVLFPMEIAGKNDSRASERARELLSLTGLAGFETYYPAQLSGGMQQRVALCRALVNRPALLLMDEPFGALDELTRMEMHDLLLAIRAKARTTIMFVTHSISEAIYLSDKVVVFGKRPARLADLIAVDIPYPRSAELRYANAFTELEHRAGLALGVTR